MARERDPTCDGCGRSVGRGSERVFASGAAVLCRRCAEARGGAYDFIHGAWSDPPELSGLTPSQRAPVVDHLPPNRVPDIEKGAGD